MNQDELHVVYTTDDANEAEVIRGALQAEGIECEIDGENQAGLTGLGIMEIKLLVRGKDVARAQQYIDNHQ